MLTNSLAAQSGGTQNETTNAIHTDARATQHESQSMGNAVAAGGDAVVEALVELTAQTIDIVPLVDLFDGPHHAPRPLVSCLEPRQTLRRTSPQHVPQPRDGSFVQ